MCVLTFSLYLSYSACAEKQQQVDDLQLAKDLLDEELFETKSEMENLRMELNEVITSQMTQTVAINEAHKLPIEELLNGIDGHGNILDLTKSEYAVANFQVLLQYTKELMKSMEDIQSLSTIQEQQLNKLKLEKKQLKALGISLREKNDLLIVERTQLEHEKDLIASQYQDVVKELEDVKGQVKEREKENDVLRQQLVDAISNASNNNNSNVRKNTMVDGDDTAIERQSVSGGGGVSVSTGSRPVSMSVSLEEINAAMIDSAINAKVSATNTTTNSNSLDGGSIHSTDSNQDYSNYDPFGVSGNNNSEPGRTIVIDFAKQSQEPDELSFLLTNMTSSLMDMMPSWSSSAASASTTASSAGSTTTTNKPTEASEGPNNTAPSTTSTTSSNKGRNGSVTNSFAGSAFRGMSFGF